VDAANAYQLQTSPQGIYWIPFPLSDTEGWKRIESIFPCWKPAIATAGAGITKEKPVEMPGQDLAFMCWPQVVSDDLAYWMTKNIHLTFDLFKDKNPNLPGWDLNQAINFDDFVLPYHPGSIKYFKEIGKWTDKNEKRNAELLAMQKQNRQAWEKEHPGW
jgi:hypothetical protein